MNQVQIRPWTTTDAAAVPTLLDREPDPYWLAQRHGVHGITARPERFALTLVAEDASGVVGVATSYENLFHPGRYPATVEVRPDARRRGVGRRLTAALLDHRPAPRPLEVKLRDANRATMAFAHAIGMRPFQHCPVPTVDPDDPQVEAWAAAHASLVAVPLGEIEVGAVVEAMVTQYVWNHAGWAPTGERARIERHWAGAVSEADRELSSVAVTAGQIGALCLVWTGEEGPAEAVAETTHRDQVDGTALVAACVARTLTAGRRGGSGPIEFDGHDDDPHFAPVIASVPASRDPVSLLELTALTAT